MKPLLQSIQTIRAALKDEAPPSSVEDAALRYAQFCTEAEQRLDRVAAMLEKGSDYQALQVAEEEPPLLDLVGTLSFGEEKNWQSFCELHGLKVAPRLNAKTVQSLEALYAKGISANHPLYKDFRAAVLSRDDDKSLKIVRTILKLNPKDDNAKKELLRIENKTLQEKIEELREALKTDDEEQIATLTEIIKASTTAAKLERVEAFQQGEGVRVALRSRQAEAKLPGLLRQMAVLKDEGNWQEVGRLLEDVNAMIKEHRLDPLPDDQASQRMAFSAYHQKESAADEKRRSFDRCLKGFVRYVEEIETRLLTGSGVTFDEIAERDETFVKRWKELEGFQLPVPNETLQRLRAAGQELRARLDRMQRARRLKNMALAASVLLVLGCLSAIGLHAWKAYSLTLELATYQNKGNCGAAEALILKLRREEELLLRWPYLQAKIGEVDGWTEQARTTEKQALAALDSLETTYQGDATSLPPATLVKQMEDAKGLVAQLVEDLAASPQNRLKALETKRDLYLAGSLKKMAAGAEAALHEIEAQTAEQLSHQKLAAQVAASCKEIDSKLRPLEQLLKPEAEALKLPADVEAKMTSQRRLLDSYTKDLEAFGGLREETAKAGTLDEYKAVLLKWQDIKFIEAAPASQALDALPTEKAFQSELLTHGDQSVLQAILDDKSSRHMSPDIPLESDQKAILSLMHDENLNEIFENTIAYYSSRKATSLYWSRGKPSESTIGGLVKWTGKFYEPESAKMAVLFIERSFGRVGYPGDYQGEAVVSSRLSLTSQMINVIGINRILDEKGERVMRPLFEIFDSLVKDQGGSPIARAYVMFKLEGMMAPPRNYEWGLHLCPSLEQDLRALHLLLGNETLRSEDWMVSLMREKWSSKLAAFFANCKTRSYMKEAVARRDYLLKAAKAGLKYVGYVETDRSIKLSQAGVAASEWWMLSKNDRKPILVNNTQAGGAASGTFVPPVVAEAAVLSPVFVVPIDRKQLVELYQQALTADGIDLKPLPGESPYLAVP